jgi:hypothetical protein
MNILADIKDLVRAHTRGVLIPKETVELCQEKTLHADLSSILCCVRDSAEEGEKLRTDPRIEISKGIIAKAQSDLLFNGKLCLTLDGQSYFSGKSWRVYDKKEGLKIVRKVF